MASSSPRNNGKIIFQCDQRPVIISEKLHSFYEENEFFDTDLVAGSNCVIIQAHRIVLCALSDYFLEIFRAGSSKLKVNVVELKEIEASTLKLIVDFMYSGSIELNLETIEELLRIASFLKIKTLVDGCCGLIKKNINYSNCLNWFRLANELGLPELKSKALECTYTYFEEISKEKKNELLMLSDIELMNLLFNDNPYGDFEEDIFSTMVAWINYDKLNREHLAFQLLSKVRFWALTPKFIVENRKLVCKTMESYELICSWLQWHLSPETRSNDQLNVALKPRKKPYKLQVITIANSDKMKIEEFDPKNNSWSNDIEITLPRQRLYYSTIEIDGKLIVVGGLYNYCAIKQVEYLDLETFKWVNIPEMKASVQLYCQLANLKGSLCLFGVDMIKSIHLQVYNFSTNKCYDLQPMSQPSKTSRIATHDGMLYILDFENGFLQSYDVCIDKWTLKKVEKDSLCYFGFSVVKGFLYVFGGSRGNDLVKTVKRYNLSDESWCEMASLPFCLSNIKTNKTENTIIIFGSQNVVEYNIESDTWNTLSVLKKEANYLYFSYQ